MLNRMTLRARARARLSATALPIREDEKFFYSILFIAINFFLL